MGYHQKMLSMRAPLALLACTLAVTPSVPADDTVQLHLDTSEADAVLCILGHRTAGEAIAGSDWQRLFESEPYRRLKRREAEMKRSFEDAEFQEFVMSDGLQARAADLERTLAAWKRIDLEANARSVLGYLPAQARIRAKVFPVIKPKTNSFVFDLKDDPTIFLYLDPAVSAAQFANTVRHELHHIGLGSVATESDLALKDLPPRARAAADWMGAFGEGMAMLAAAGGPDVHPHADSSPEDRARWDHDVANFSRDLRTVERFFLDVIDGRLKGEDAIRRKAFTFYGVQGPWYTVGWKMATIVEKAYGRQTLVDCMLDPRRLLASYNRAVNSGNAGALLPKWSPRLLRAIHAHTTSRRYPRASHGASQLSAVFGGPGPTSSGATIATRLQWVFCAGTCDRRQVMRTSRVLELAGAVVVGGTALVHSADAKQRIALKLAFADGTQVKVTEVEGRTAEVKQAGSNGLHLGLVPTCSKQLVTIQIIDLAGKNRKPLAKVSGPIGEPMEFWTGDRTDPPTLRITPERVY